jgi:hypothetical protein
MVACSAAAAAAHHVPQDAVCLLHVLAHDTLVGASVHERRLRVCRPLELDAQQRDLCRVAEDEVLQAHLLQGHPENSMV